MTPLERARRLAGAAALAALVLIAAPLAQGGPRGRGMAGMSGDEDQLADMALIHHAARQRARGQTHRHDAGRRRGDDHRVR